MTDISAQSDSDTDNDTDDITNKNFKHWTDNKLLIYRTCSPQVYRGPSGL